MDYQRKKNWNEFEWEALIREDEKRIHSYFHELKQFIDLPNEEDMILDNMRTKSNAVNNSNLLTSNEANSSNEINNADAVNDSNINQWLNFNEDLSFSHSNDSEDEDDEDFDAENNVFDVDLWQNKEGSELFLLLEKLACRWSNIFVMSLNYEQKKLGMVILCDFGKLTTRTTDLFSFNGENFPTFKISLLKRMHSIINKLIGNLMIIKENQDEIDYKINSLIDHLQNAREKVIDLITAQS
ncbi:hypothetical protein AAEX28_00295 [Lentisphaerota bacterium WC36G]|nr:hypothetical protein LJT99_03175 [Lentisphaerae bacterium WC36]